MPRLGKRELEQYTEQLQRRIAWHERAERRMFTRHVEAELVQRKRAVIESLQAELKIVVGWLNAIDGTAERVPTGASSVHLPVESKPLKPDPDLSRYSGKRKRTKGWHLRGEPPGSTSAGPP